MHRLEFADEPQLPALSIGSNYCEWQTSVLVGPPPQLQYGNDRDKEWVSQSHEQKQKGECQFTPPVHTFYAFEEALDELLEEGVLGRISWYKKASSYLREEFRKLRLEFLLPQEFLSNTITALYLPENMTYDYLHDNLKERGFIIYAGQGELNKTIFRIANMGELTMDDLEALIKNLQEVLSE